MTATDRHTPVMRVIARLNIGGPAIQAITLTRRLEAFGYETRLVRGAESAAEGNMDYLARELGVKPTLIPQMRRDPGLADFAALARLIRIIRTDRPAIVHTHAAKGGTLGRLAVLIAFPRRGSRPVVVHTYHGHSLTGYFSRSTAGFYRLLEKLLARMTDRLIAVSDQVRDDLVRLQVAPRQQFEVVPLGFDLSPFTDATDRHARRQALRREWAVEDDELLVTLIARLVAIKRVDRFLEAAAALSDAPNVRFAIVGDGELRAELEASAGARGLSRRLIWAGFRRDVADVCFASDVVMLTSDNEGTPVSLIEAQAAAVPVVATDVGGVAAVVEHGVTGFLAAPDDVAGLTSSVRALLDSEALRLGFGAAGRERVRATYTLERLVADHVLLYQRLLAGRS